MKIILTRTSYIGGLLERMGILKPIIITITPISRKDPQTIITSDSEKFRTALTFEKKQDDDRLFKAIFVPEDFSRSPVEFEPFGLGSTSPATSTSKQPDEKKEPARDLSKAERKVIACGIAAIFLSLALSALDQEINTKDKK